VRKFIIALIPFLVGLLSGFIVNRPFSQGYCNDLTFKIQEDVRKLKHVRSQTFLVLYFPERSQFTEPLIKIGNDLTKLYFRSEIFILGIAENEHPQLEMCHFPIIYRPYHGKYPILFLFDRKRSLIFKFPAINLNELQTDRLKQILKQLMDFTIYRI